MARHLKLLSVLLPAVIVLAACGSVADEVDNSPESNQVESSASPTVDTALGAEVESEPADEAPEPVKEPEPEPVEEVDYEIVTLLPRDAIPAIDNPVFLSASEADGEYAPTELVLGVEFNGDARAYSTSFLSGHEIVNDTVGGVKISVTW